MENDIMSFREQIQVIDPAFTRTADIETLQLNLGDLCNLSCRHCHHGASPSGQKLMNREVMDQITCLLKVSNGVILDVTGGAPELHPEFRAFIEMTKGRAAKRILRSNLAIMTEPGMEWLPEFCQQQQLAITASLPCYLLENVDAQRGDGTYGKSITAIKKLNDLGYGSRLELNLVYNPGGRFLPPSQTELEAAYRKELMDTHGIIFSNLFTITNAPIGRFREELVVAGKLESYLALLTKNFNPAAAGSIMCRRMLSVNWQGHLFNCDFNQAVNKPLRSENGDPLTVFGLESLCLAVTEIQFGDYCYCCTAGEGSSCSGALTVL